MSSLPVKVFVIRPPGHGYDGELSFYSTPTAKLAVSFLHFVRCLKLFKYSRIQRFQKNCVICCVNFQGCGSVKTCHLSLANYESGNTSKAEPLMKCPGVRTSKSLGSVDIGLTGRELRATSTCVSTA